MSIIHFSPLMKEKTNQPKKPHKQESLQIKNNPNKTPQQKNTPQKTSVPHKRQQLLRKSNGFYPSPGTFPRISTVP